MAKIDLIIVEIPKHLVFVSSCLLDISLLSHISTILALDNITFSGNFSLSVFSFYFSSIYLSSPYSSPASSVNPGAGVPGENLRGSLSSGPRGASPSVISPQSPRGPYSSTQENPKGQPAGYRQNWVFKFNFPTFQLHQIIPS